jgi:hydroxypyruvate isomerase
MKRRHFFTTGAGSLALGALGTTSLHSQTGDQHPSEDSSSKSASEPFKVLFAPNPGHFEKTGSQKGYLAAMQKAYDLGFRAWEDNGLPGRGAELQSAVGTFLKEHGMTMGVSVVSTGGSFVLADYYHQQQMGGDLMKNTDKCWDEIAYVQYGDVPGRKQPGTGEINYTNVTQHLVDKGYQGIIGLEHGIQGKLADLTKAYREIDAALTVK